MNGRFRVWDGETMHEPPHGYVLVDDGRVHHESDGSLDSFRDVEPLFSTGLTDAEGNEVWEGDVLESQCYTWQVLVTWFERRCQFYLRHWGDQYHTEWCNDLTKDVIGSSEYIVIGNRYEHPELMEEVSA